MPREPYLAASLVKLRDEVNTRWPNRDKTSDGWIGDASHSARVSDHNPDWTSRPPGVVRALDVDKDGIAPWWVVRSVIGDNRLAYVIFNRTIWSADRDWQPRRYSGPNPHEAHIHFSIKHTERAADNVTRWLVGQPPDPKPPAPITPPTDGNIIAEDDMPTPDELWRYKQGDNPEAYDAAVSTFRNSARTVDALEKIVTLLTQIRDQGKPSP